MLRPDAPSIRIEVTTVAVLLALASACGPGPTEGPKGPELPPISLGFAADAGPTTASVAERGPGSTRTKDIDESAKTSALRIAAEERRAAQEAADGPPGDAGPDPMGGSFTMAQAVAGLAGTGAVAAMIKTSKGDLRCKLFEDKAPIAVANFVGLARGTRPFKSGSKWVERPAYDGTSFHRIIKGFMIQGGDPQGTGRGEPGYVFKDELWAGAKHDRAGLLCMANRGPDTNGMQFFITDASAPHLDRSYTIFGECSPVSVVHAIANVPTDPGDRPQQEVTIVKVEIVRASGSGGAPAANPAATPASPAAPANPAAAPPAATGTSKLPPNPVTQPKAPSPTTP